MGKARLEKYRLGIGLGLKKNTRISMSAMSVTSPSRDLLTSLSNPGQTMNKGMWYGSGDFFRRIKNKR